MSLFTDTTTVRRALATALAPLALSFVLTACGGSAAPAATPAVDTATAAPTGGNATAAPTAAGAGTATGTDVAGVPPLTRASYTAAARALLDEITAATDRIEAVLARADIESSAWRAELGTALGALVAQQPQVAALKPPDSLALVQQLLEEATGDFASAADALIAGVKVKDLGQIQRGVDDLDLGIEAITEARAVLPALS